MKSIPEKFLKFRLECDFFELVIKPFDNKFNYFFSVDIRKRSSLKELRNLLKTLILFKKSVSGLILEIEPEALPAFTFKISINEEIDDYSEPYEISEMAVYICQKFVLSEDDVSISLEDLKKYSSSIKNFYRVITFEPRKFKIDFNVNGEGYQGGVKSACVNLFSMVIGNKIIGAIIGFIGVPTSLEQGRYRLIPDELLIGSKLIAKEGELIDEIFIKSEFEKFLKQLEQKDIVPIRFQGGTNEDRLRRETGKTGTMAVM
jgi:hypothetical protein